MQRSSYDAVVVGAGQNGLAAAIVLAQAGRSVLVIEGEDEIGGSARTLELTLPGYMHDICSIVHPMGAASPFFRSLPLERHGLEWVHSPALLAHPLDDGTAVVWERSLEAATERLGEDGPAYESLIGPFLRRWEDLAGDALGPLHWPEHPLLLARFGWTGMRSAWGVARSRFRTERARLLLTGIASHAVVPPERVPTASFGLLLSVFGHAVGWPIARGGSRSIVAALAAHLRSLGGEIVTGWRVGTLDELPSSRATLLDLTPRQVLQVAGDRLPPRYRAALRRYRYGPGAFKMDWALSGPVPWTAPECARAATVHLVGPLDELLGSGQAAWDGELPERPFVVLVQPTRFDPSRAPPGGHTIYAYCHVPHGCTVDLSERIEAQVERFAPGFRDLIIGRSVLPPPALERHNPNLVGGDINAGAEVPGQIFFRPTIRLDPYATPVAGLYLCSASTPPGGSVHGMCGYHAARSALRWMERAAT